MQSAWFASPFWYWTLIFSTDVVSSNVRLSKYFRSYFGAVDASICMCGFALRIFFIATLFITPQPHVVNIINTAEMVRICFRMYATPFNKFIIAKPFVLRDARYNDMLQKFSENARLFGWCVFALLDGDGGLASNGEGKLELKSGNG